MGVGVMMFKPNFEDFFFVFVFAIFTFSLGFATRSCTEKPKIVTKDKIVTVTKIVEVEKKEKVDIDKVEKVFSKSGKIKKEIITRTKSSAQIKTAEINNKNIESKSTTLILPTLKNDWAFSVGYKVAPFKIDCFNRFCAQNLQIGVGYRLISNLFLSTTVNYKLSESYVTATMLF